MYITLLELPKSTNLVATFNMNNNNNNVFALLMAANKFLPKVSVHVGVSQVNDLEHILNKEIHLDSCLLWQYFENMNTYIGLANIKTDLKMPIHALVFLKEI